MNIRINELEKKITQALLGGEIATSGDIMEDWKFLFFLSKKINPQERYWYKISANIYDGFYTCNICNSSFITSLKEHGDFHIKNHKLKLFI